MSQNGDFICQTVYLLGIHEADEEKSEKVADGGSEEVIYDLAAFFRAFRVVRG